METQEIRAHKVSPRKNKKSQKSGSFSWDAFLAEVARITREDGLYPEEMPNEDFEVY